MNAPKKPAIWADAMQLAAEIELAVRGWVGAGLPAKGAVLPAPNIAAKAAPTKSALANSVSGMA